MQSRNASSDNGIEPLASVQILRALAALAITFAHLNYEFTHKLGVPDFPAFRTLGAGVDLFFVISGFIMVHVSQPLFGRSGAPFNFFLRRLARIVPLYWVTTTLLLIYMVVQYRDLAGVGIRIDNVAASYLFFPWPGAPVYGVGWTLVYEMFFYAAFAFTLLGSSISGPLALAGIFVLLVVLGPYLSAIIGEPITTWSNPIILEFVLGMLIGVARANGFRLPAWSRWYLVAAAVVFLVFAEVYRLSEPRLIVWGIPGAALVMAAVLAASANPVPAVARPLVVLGDASYALYLLHPFSTVAPRFLFPSLIVPDQQPWLYAAMLLLLAIVFALVAYFCFERPLTRFLSRSVARVAPIEGRPSVAPVFGAS